MESGYANNVVITKLVTVPTTVTSTETPYPLRIESVSTKMYLYAAKSIFVVKKDANRSMNGKIHRTQRMHMYKFAKS